MKEYARRYAWWGIGLVLAGCSAQASAPVPTATLPVANVITGEGIGESQRFKVKLTLTAPDDLKVREGDSIIAGQIVADRVRDRTRLQFQKDSLTTEIARLRQMQSIPVPDVKALPGADFAEEAADIEATKHAAEEAMRAKEQQQRKLSVLQSMPAAELPEAVIPHEQLILDEKERAYNQAAAAIDLARGKLSKAQEQRRIKEYEHSLEMSKRAIAMQQQSLQSQGQLADLEARLSQVEISLSQLSAVRSPYSGRVQRIKFEGQSDQNLAVELTLVISSSSRPGAVNPSPTPGSSSGSSPTAGGSSTTGGAGTQ